MTNKDNPTSAGVLGPELIVRTIRGSLHSGILKAAVSLDLFNIVSRGVDDVDGVTEAISGDQRIVRMLLDALCGFGLLAKLDGRYSLTPFSRSFLVDDPEAFASSADYREVFAVQWQAFGGMDQLARTGRPVIDPRKFGAEASYWEALVRYLIPFAVAPAEAAARLLGFDGKARRGTRILDLACGSGYLGYRLAQLDPEAAVVSNDWENVLKVSRSVATKMGVADRVSYLPGDSLSLGLGSGYDLVIVSRVLTTMDLEGKNRLLGRAHSALKPGGAVLINDPIADDARVAATDQLAFALLIAGFHEEGGTYTFVECREWLAGAGFVNVKYHPVPGESSLVTARKA
ncbi:MAG: methyltransferase domain-containing protein [Chloroflexi bacterium]|nr:methyltransferase domain-containing protein [Chloroflexota bacterium]